MGSLVLAIKLQSNTAPACESSNCDMAAGTTIAGMACGRCELKSRGGEEASVPVDQDCVNPDMDTCRQDALLCNIQHLCSIDLAA